MRTAHNIASLVVLLFGSYAHGATRTRTITGTVSASHGTWDGDVIVTESEVVADGSVVHVAQLGGVADGVGMILSHVPGALVVGERVTLDISDATTAGGRTVAVLDRVVSRQAAALPSGTVAAGPPVGAAPYGLQHTINSGRTLWRSSGCIDVVYDHETVTPQMAGTLDQAFGAWATAVDKAQCGGLSITRSWGRGIAAVNDGISTVRVHSDRWCHPKTPVSPEICYPSEVAAVTKLIFTDQPGSPDDGEIMDADMELNAVDFVLLQPSDVPPAPGGSKPALFVRAVVTHEAGHLIGLGHDCGTGTEAWPLDDHSQPVPACDGATGDVTSATMYFAVGELDDGPSTLEASDVAGACAIARTQTCASDVLGGCSVGPVSLGGGTDGPAPIVPGLLIFGVSALLVQRRRWSPRAA